MFFFKRGGGLLIYVSTGLTYEIVDIPTITLCTSDYEVMTIKILLKCTKPTYSVNIYRPPEGNIDSFITMITQLVNSLPEAAEGKTIIGGDLNINFLDKGKANTKTLQKVMDKLSLVQQIKDITYPTGHGSVIDLTLTNLKYIKESGSCLSTLVITYQYML